MTSEEFQAIFQTPIRVCKEHRGSFSKDCAVCKLERARNEMVQTFWFVSGCCEWPRSAQAITVQPWPPGNGSSTSSTSSTEVYELRGNEAGARPHHGDCRYHGGPLRQSGWEVQAMAATREQRVRIGARPSRGPLLVNQVQNMRCAFDCFVDGVQHPGLFDVYNRRALLTAGRTEVSVLSYS